MAGYFGTDEQKALQARAEASVPEMSTKPGLCQNGRMVGCDDIDALGWPSIYEILDRDGFVGFRLIPAAREQEVRDRLAQRGFRLDTWNLFIASKEAILSSCTEIVKRPLPPGLTVLPMPDDPEGPYMHSVQALIASTGIMPFSGSLLAGLLGSARTVVVGAAEHALAATAHAYLPHNQRSRYRTYAWGGLVAVADTYRGLGLGRYVNALLAITALRELGASHLYEMISADNVASLRMAEACGLRHDPSFLCGSATRSDRGRFTR
jgi:GNAT superfamily N-acetyltransferase